MSGFNQSKDQSASDEPGHVSAHAVEDATSNLANEANAVDASPEISDERLSQLTQAELVALGGQLDHVTIISQEYLFEAGSQGEKRAERQVALCFTLSALLVLAFVVIFIAWPWSATDAAPGEFTLATYYTPLLGLTLGGGLAFMGAGLVLWAKKLMPHEVSVQERHEGASPEVERLATAATMMAGVDDIGFTRRTAIRRSLLGAGSVLGLAVVVPLIGGLIKNPYKDNALYYTSWKKGIRLVRVNGTPVRPKDMEPGSLETVFPAVEGGNRQADAATMLIRLHHDQAERFKARPGQSKFKWNEYVAFSKICSHLGCPVSLYEQETGRILCPCHQSQFDITKDAAPIFGPATRSLPQLPIELDNEGFFVARSDYVEAVGPGFWDRERRP